MNGDEMKRINLKEKLDKISESWSPKVIAEMNDYQFKLVKMTGDFVWHDHTDTDEAFIVIEGTLCIEFADRIVVIVSALTNLLINLKGEILFRNLLR